MPEDTASSIADVNSTLNNNETSTTSSDPTTSSEIDVWPEDTVSNIADITLFPNRNDNAAASRDQSTDDFEESGTPSVLLRRRRINLVCILQDMH